MIENFPRTGIRVGEAVLKLKLVGKFALTITFETAKGPLLVTTIV
jgi:hypothetical protein